MPLPFETVREKLLQAGIAPRHASRYVTELREHLADLTARERASGLDARQAADRAKALLGGDAELAQAMIDKGAPRALVARAPWSVFALLPVALFGAMFWATAFSSAHRYMAPPEVPESYQGLVAVVGFVARYLVGPLLLTGCITVALRQRLSSRWVWVGLGLVALFSGLLGIQVIPAEGGHKGGMFLSPIGMVYWHGHWSTVATFGTALLRATVLFAMAGTAYRFLRARLMPSHT